MHDPASHDPSDILEIKYPYTKCSVAPEEACQDLDFYSTLDDGHMKLRKLTFTSTKFSYSCMYILFFVAGVTFVFFLLKAAWCGNNI